MLSYCRMERPREGGRRGTRKVNAGEKGRALGKKQEKMSKKQELEERREI